jgi:hypothetical protein
MMNLLFILSNRRRAATQRAQPNKKKNELLTEVEQLTEFLVLLPQETFFCHSFFCLLNVSTAEIQTEKWRTEK